MPSALFAHTLLNSKAWSIAGMAISAIYGLSYLLLSAWSTHNPMDTVVAQKSIEIALHTQIIHALAILVLGAISFVPVLNRYAKYFVWVQYFWILGVILFNGMIYLKHLMGITDFGMLTPLGGFLLIVGWVLLFGVFVSLFFTIKRYHATEG
ncbi:DUF423 domain-containing protein [Opacimonas viscosa]|uniref:DUF423 domain-containing protein n=1 Tax=Opacimonas viscosa TaxID=2961944 RepID=A0AA42BLJ0_9ALTE|nr:DUF423 domain-containing protein [Opacimonas viscosa]MCP3427642.1 DUF423 domain-containing protein [Opacimonas viscosa]